jgi:hypothetical protein
MFPIDEVGEVRLSFLIMEAELRANLDALVSAYGALCGLAPTAVAGLAFKDKSFFWRLDNNEGASFTVKKYDEAVRWFSANWPEGAAWPEGVARIEPHADAA